MTQEYEEKLRNAQDMLSALEAQRDSLLRTAHNDMIRLAASHKALERRVAEQAAKIKELEAAPYSNGHGANQYQDEMRPC
jgi:vacuolar-type H+-ATPase subunit D/Vma8